MKRFNRKTAGISSILHGKKMHTFSVQRQKELVHILKAPKNERKTLQQIIQSLKGAYSLGEIAKANQSLPPLFHRKVHNTPALRKQRLAQLEEAVKNANLFLYNNKQYAKAHGMNVQTTFKMREKLLDLGLHVDMTVEEKKKFVLSLRKFEGIA